MKNYLNIIVLIFGLAALTACSSTGSMVGGSSGYGYYDDMYYYGYPNYWTSPYASPYYYPGRIYNNVIVVPEKKPDRVREPRDLRRRDAVSPNTRRTVVPSEPNRNINRSTAPNVNRSTTPERRGSNVAPSRSTTPQNRESARPAPTPRSRNN